MPKRPGENTARYDAWRKAIKRRDNYTCQMPSCGYHGYCTQVHHIHKYSEYPELRYQQTNGITLCKNCHKKVTGFEAIWVALFSRLVAEKMDKKKK